VAAKEAREGGFVIEEAIANELYGDFLISRGMKLAGSMLVQHASKKFYSYGAAAKCKLLEEKYPRSQFCEVGEGRRKGIMILNFNALKILS
jgi:hypothetical protein